MDDEVCDTALFIGVMNSFHSTYLHILRDQISMYQSSIALGLMHMDDLPTSHVALHHLRVRLQTIHESISSYQPLTGRPPILDSSLDTAGDEDGQWLQQDNVQGLKRLKDWVKIDLDVLEKVKTSLFAS